MSMFDRILEKLGLRKEKTDIAGTAKVVYPEPPSSPSSMTSMPAKKPASPAPVSDDGVKITRSVGDEGTRDAFDRPQGGGTSRTMSEVNVMSMLEQKAKGTGLNWKQSVSDLLILLDLDNSLKARMELAKELGAPADVMNDSTRLSTWLHKMVLRKIAENGGNIPSELLDQKLK